MSAPMPNLAAAGSAPRRPMPPSPCVGVCETDEASRLCRGCARSPEEIDAWREADEAYRAAVWADLPARAAAMGLAVRRLAWEPAEILDFVEATLREARGRWTFGVYGATVAFRVDPGAPPTIRREVEAVEAVAPFAALRVRVPRGTRAMAWRAAPDAPERIVLALPTARLGEPGPSVPTPLVPDDAPLLPGDAADRLDLGLGRAEARFLLRGDGTALAAAQAVAEAADALAAMGGAGAAAVAESPLGRAEAALGATPETVGLSSERLRGGRAVPPALKMPGAYFAGCLYTPER